MKRPWGPVAAFVVGLAVFVALAAGTRWLETRFGLGIAAGHALLKSLLLVVALAAMVLDGRPWSEFGFRPASGQRWGRVAGSGALLGVLATGMLWITPAAGLGLAKEMSLLQIALGVWLYSSLTEEIFFRGWIQSRVRPGPAGRSPFSVPVWVGGVLFGALHLGLLFRGTDPWTAGILFVFTTVLGLVAGRFREQSGSLLPALVAHVAFNLGGLPIGVAAAIAKKLASGGAP